LPERAPWPPLGTVLAALCVTEIVPSGLLYDASPVPAPRITADSGWSDIGERLLCFPPAGVV